MCNVCTDLYVPLKLQLQLSDLGIKYQEHKAWSFWAGIFYPTVSLTDENESLNYEWGEYIAICRKPDNLNHYQLDFFTYFKQKWKLSTSCTFPGVNDRKLPLDVLVKRN